MQTCSAQRLLQTLSIYSSSKWLKYWTVKELELRTCSHLMFEISPPWFEKQSNGYILVCLLNWPSLEQALACKHWIFESDWGQAMRREGLWCGGELSLETRGQRSRQGNGTDSEIMTSQTPSLCLSRLNSLTTFIQVSSAWTVLTPPRSQASVSMC